ncbi:uncharacterized protein LOC144624158 isoform X2 [Crassostrea virginica]
MQFRFRMRGVLEICALYLTIVQAYENLSRRNTTIITQSSTFDKNFASLANDGVLVTTLDLCGYTNPGKSKAWLQVDLGQAFSITRVKVYYRKEGNGPDDWKQYRFRQFYLDVSNLPATEAATIQRKRCYTDKTTYPHLPPNVIDIPCKHVVRYVIVETTYDAPEDKYTGAMLEVCEIEVYGCSIGYFGDDCKMCSDCYMCDIDNGRCFKVTAFSTDHLYVFIAVIIPSVSLLLIISLVFRCHKKKILTTQKQSPDTTNKVEERNEEDMSEINSTYENVANGVLYQELCPFGEPSHYDEIKWNE